MIVIIFAKTICSYQHIHDLDFSRLFGHGSNRLQNCFYLFYRFTTCNGMQVDDSGDGICTLVDALYMLKGLVMFLLTVFKHG